MNQSKEALPSGVHVILGDSAGGIFTRNWGRQNLLVDRDVLNCGPTPTCESLAAWKAMRLEFWKSLVPGSDLSEAATLNLSDDADQLRDAERIHIWAATGLSEQLFIAYVVQLVDALAVDTARVRLLQFEDLRGRRARVAGMGELDEENMADHPEPVPLASETVEDYRAAWNALTSADPKLCEHFRATRPNANTRLKHAMQLMLRRFPDWQTGLVHWDRVLLEKVREHGPRAMRVIGHSMGDDGSDGDLVGDWFLFGRLLRLGDERLAKPLLALGGIQRDMRQLEVTLTPFGLQVLEGKASSYPINPIEDWAGGVKLSSVNGSLWFNKGGTLVHA